MKSFPTYPWKGVKKREDPSTKSVLDILYFIAFQHSLSSYIVNNIIILYRLIIMRKRRCMSDEIKTYKVDVSCSGVSKRSTSSYHVTGLISCSEIQVLAFPPGRKYRRWTKNLVCSLQLALAESSIWSNACNRLSALQAFPLLNNIFITRLKTWFESAGTFC